MKPCQHPEIQGEKRHDYGFWHHSAASLLLSCRRNDRTAVVVVIVAALVAVDVEVEVVGIFVVVP